MVVLLATDDPRRQPSHAVRSQKKVKRQELQGRHVLRGAKYGVHSKQALHSENPQWYPTPEKQFIRKGNEQTRKKPTTCTDCDIRVDSWTAMPSAAEGCWKNRARSAFSAGVKDGSAPMSFCVFPSWRSKLISNASNRVRRDRLKPTSAGIDTDTEVTEPEEESTDIARRFLLLSRISSRDGIFPPFCWRKIFTTFWILINTGWRLSQQWKFSWR